MDLGGLVGLGGAANGATAAFTVVNGLLGVGNSVSSAVTSGALAVTYVVLAYNALNSSGLLPQIQGVGNSLGSILLPSSILPTAAACRV